MSDQASIVFPPFNHEGIHLHLHNHREIDMEPTALPSPVSTPRSRPEESTTFGWWNAGTDVLRFKFDGVVSLVRSFCINRGLIWPNVTLAGSMVVLLLFYLRFRRRRQLRKQSITQLIRLIKEKDEVRCFCFVIVCSTGVC